MADAPIGNQYGKVVGLFVSFWADGPDQGTTPDERTYNGTVTFTPTVAVVRLPGLVEPRTATIQVATCPIIGGRIYPPDTKPSDIGAVEPGVWLMATDQPGMQPEHFQWSASVNLVGAAVQPGTSLFDVPAQGVVDLANILPTSPEPNIVTVVSLEERIAAEGARDEATDAAALAAKAAEEARTAASMAAGEVLENVATTFKPGEPGGVAQLDNTGAVPEVQLPERLSPTQLSTQIAQQVQAIDQPVSKGVLGGLRVTKVDKYPTVYDGVKVLSRGTLFTTIWSTEDYVYVGEPVTIDGVAQSRVSRINKATGISDQDRLVRSSNHDPNLGHRGCTVAVDRNGVVIVHGEIHQGNTAFWRSAAASPYSLSGMIEMADPLGATQSAYRRIKRDPYTGDLWLILRGDDYAPRIYKWNETTLVFDLVGANPLAVGVGGYGNDLAFSRAGVIYMAPEFITVGSNPAASGYPRRDIGLVQSFDGGASWAAMDGTPIPSGGISPDTVSVLYPHPEGADLTTYDSHNSATGRVGVAADGAPVVVALWRDPSETSNAAELSLYATKVDPYTGRTTRVKLLQAPTGASAGHPWLAYNRDGYIAVVAPAMFSDTAFEDCPLYLFTTTDGLRWNRHTLYDGTGGAGFGGADIDAESLRREGLIRIQPYSILDPSLSEVWEVRLTDAPLIEAGTTTAVYEPTDPAPEPGVLYTQSFDMADGTTLPTGWTYRTGAPVTNSFVIASNQLGLNTSSVALHLVQPPTQPGWADHYAEMDVTAIGAAGTYHPVVVVRYNGELSGYLGRYNPTTGAWEIFDLAGGAVLASFVETTPALPYTLRMEADGGTVRLLVNGTEKVSHTPATPLTATGVALGMRRNNSQAGDNAQRVDNWEHGIV